MLLAMPVVGILGSMSMHASVPETKINPDPPASMLDMPVSRVLIPQQNAS